MMKRRKQIAGGLLALIILTLVGGIWSWRRYQATQMSKSSMPIRIGSKDFTENLIVAEIYALALEDHGYRVERVSNISSSLIHNAIVSNDIDLYPEYTGTGLLSILGEKMETNSDKVYETVKNGYEKRFQLTWLKPSLANDSQGLVIRTDVAKKLHIQTISDLQAHANNLRFASQGEFDERDDGLPGLEKTYGPFKWKSSNVYDNSLKYSILANNQADVSPTYTTEGQLINTNQFTLLEDDKHFWPPYNVAPVVRDDVLAKYPDVASILNHVSATLDTKTVTQLNAKVDVDGQDYTKVAKAYYESIKD